MQRNSTDSKNISQQILNLDLIFRRSTFNWLLKKQISCRGASPHTFNLTWCLWCVIAETVAVCRRVTVTPPTQVQWAASVSPVCLVTTRVTKQEAKHRVEVRLMTAELVQMVAKLLTGCFPVYNVQKLLNDWRTVALAEPQWGGEDLKLCVLSNFISCSVTPNDKAYELIKQVCITCKT